MRATMDNARNAVLDRGNDVAIPAGEAFARWARGVLLDDDGRALVLWHGDIDIGDRTRIMSRECSTFHGVGVFFATDRIQAVSYDRERKPRSFFVRADRLLDLTVDTAATRLWVAQWAALFNPWIDRASGEPIDPFELIQAGYLYDYEGAGSAERWNDLFAEAKYGGFDAVKVHDATDGVNAQIVVSFCPKNIKAAVGNSGDFNRDCEDAYDGAAPDGVESPAPKRARSLSL